MKSYIIYIPSIYFLLLLIFNSTRKKTLLTISNLLISAYFLSSVASIYLYFLNPYKIHLEPTLYLLLVLTLYFYPFLKIKDQSFQISPLVRFPSVKLITQLLVGINLVGLVFFSIYLPRVLSGNLLENRLFIASGSLFVPRGIINTITGTAAYFFPFLIILFFYFLVFYKAFRYKYLILISSLSFIAYVTTYVGRDGVVFWLLLFTFAYFLFYKFLTKKLKRIIIIPLLTIISLSLGLFIAITTSRFGFSYAISSIVDYIGQNLKHFNEIYSLGVKPLYGKSNFPLLFEIGRQLGISDYAQTKVMDATRAKYLSVMDINVFATFVGSFILDFGKLGTIISGFIYIFLFRMTIGFKKRQYDLVDILSLTLFYIIPFMGVFYFRLYHRGGNIFILLSIILIIYLSTKRIRKAYGIHFS